MVETVLAQELLAVELGGLLDAADLRFERLVFGVEEAAVDRRIAAVRGLHRQLSQAPHDRMHLGQRALRRLHHAHCVLRVALGDGERPNLGGHALADREACRVIRRRDDPKTTREAVKARVERGGRTLQVLLRLQRRDVGLDRYGHCLSPASSAARSTAYSFSLRAVRARRATRLLSTVKLLASGTRLPDVSR